MNRLRRTLRGFEESPRQRRASFGETFSTAPTATIYSLLFVVLNQKQLNGSYVLFYR